MQHPRKPPVLVERTVAEHLEVLNGVPLRRIGVIQTEHETGACHRLLNRAVNAGGFGQAGCLQDRRRNINHVGELAANLALALDGIGPVDHHAVAGAAEIRGYLLGPLEGRVKGDGPARGHMGESVLATPLVKARQQILNLLNHLVEVGHFVVHADKAAFGTGAVIARDIDDQGVVQFADIFNGVHQSADIDVGVLHEACEHLGLAGKQLAMIFRQVLPGTQVLGSIRQLGCFRDNAHGLLLGHGVGSHLVPALVELALVLVRPLFRYVVGCVHGAGCKVHEEGLVRRHGLLRLHPANGLVGHVIGEVVALLVGWIHPSHTIVDQGIPLVGFTANKAIEFVKARVSGPAIKGSRDARLPGGGLVPLSKGPGAVAIQAHHFSQGSDPVGYLTGVARKGGSRFHDGAGVGAVVVAPGLQCIPGRRTQGGGMEVVVAQPALRQSVQCRGVDGASKGRGGAKADIVDQHDDHIGRALGRRHGE